MNVTDEVKAQVRARIASLIIVAAEKLNVEVSHPHTIYSKKGRVAGTMNSWGQMNLNPILLMENVSDFIHRTVAHELAHHVVNKMRSEAGVTRRHKGWSSHGAQWKAVMRAFGAPTSRCHSYDTSNAAVRTRRPQARHAYKCDCDTWIFSPIRHKRAQAYISRPDRAEYYQCPKCNGGIRQA